MILGKEDEFVVGKDERQWRKFSWGWAKVVGHAKENRTVKRNGKIEKWQDCIFGALFLFFAFEFM